MRVVSRIEDKNSPPIEGSFEFRISKFCARQGCVGSGDSDEIHQTVCVTIDGVEIPFADTSLMIRLKQSVRPKDKMDLQFLMALEDQKKG